MNTTLIIAFLLIVGFTLLTKNVGIGILISAVILLIYKLSNHKNLFCNDKEDDTYHQL